MAKQPALSQVYYYPILARFLRSPSKSSCAWRLAYISSHDAQWRRSFEQRRGGVASQRGETAHQYAAAAPTLVDAEAERASRLIRLDRR
jgi:hypothetical protein